jgi:hypothetical protein
MPDAAKQTKVYHVALAVEDEALRAAIEAEIATRGGGAAKVLSDGMHHKHLADIVREALADFLAVE